MTTEFIDHNWEKHYTLKENDVYVEAGAYKGVYGKIASLKGCKVILIEPNPDNIELISKNLESIKLKNVTIVYSAVGSKKGNTRTSFHEASVNTLDDILEHLKIKCVDLLCCDIEGSEIDMIKGSHNYFSQRKIKNVTLS